MTVSFAASECPSAVSRKPLSGRLMSRKWLSRHPTHPTRSDPSALAGNGIIQDKSVVKATFTTLTVAKVAFTTPALRTKHGTAVGEHAQKWLEIARVFL
ncbi:hypothetical protein HDA45_000152 [Amycolatopsis umgeniensis]|uniref:Uncharacterized protein n=1 Tax=Amycolatopsis umgeniensis TaxID=336628 RepID=A0A841AUL4_9PSEU|nr:hypothetical protein [Amycolatopsis umgeniensis]